MIHWESVTSLFPHRCISSLPSVIGTPQTCRDLGRSVSQVWLANRNSSSFPYSYSGQWAMLPQIFLIAFEKSWFWCYSSSYFSFERSIFSRKQSFWIRLLLAPSWAWNRCLRGGSPAWSPSWSFFYIAWGLCLILHQNHWNFHSTHHCLDFLWSQKRSIPSGSTWRREGALTHSTRMSLGMIPPKTVQGNLHLPHIKCTHLIEIDCLNHHRLVCY